MLPEGRQDHDGVFHIWSVLHTDAERITSTSPQGVDRLLPPGAYEVITDEEMIEGLSFPSFRRVATMIMVPCAAPRQSATEMVSIGSIDLADAQRMDASASHG